MKKLIPMLLLWTSALGALAQGTVVPNGFATVEGNSSASDLLTASSFRLQMVFDASQFGTIPFFINRISFRLDGASTGAVGTSFGGSSIQFSTTGRTPDNLSSVFADNIGSDVMTVREGAVPIGGAVYQPGAIPQPFGSGISLTPFLYNPAQGNLLLDISAADGLALFPGALDAQSTTGDGISRVFALNGNSLSGNPDTLGLVTRFQFTIVPEPAAWMLALCGLVGLALLRRR